MAEGHLEKIENTEQAVAYLLSQEAQRPGERLVRAAGEKPVHIVVAGNHVRRFLPPPTQADRRDRQEAREIKRIKDDLLALGGFPHQGGQEVTVVPAPPESRSYYPKTLEELQSLSFEEKLLLAGWTEVAPTARDKLLQKRSLPPDEALRLWNEMLPEMRKGTPGKDGGETAGEKFAKFIEAFFELIIALFSPVEENIDQPTRHTA